MIKELIVLLFLTSSVCLADDDSKHILYSIKKDGKVSHILGTLHTVKSDAKTVHPLLPDLISQSRVGLFEITNKQDRFDGLDAFLEEFYGKRDLSESSLDFSDEVKKRLEVFVSEISSEHSHLKYWPMMLPGILYLSLKEAIFSLSKTLTPENSDRITFDRRLRVIFKEHKKPLIALDADQRYLKAFHYFITLEGLSQFILKKLPEASFNAVLDKARLISNSKKESTLKIAFEVINEEKYLEDDVAGLLTEDFEEGIERSVIEIANLYGRNAIWASKILEEFEKGGAFVVVGLAHLHLQSKSGKSLLEIFMDNGYTLKALPKANYSNVGLNSASCFKKLTGE